MKRRELRRLSDRLEGREEFLRRRFLDPIMSITAWDAGSIDFGAAYVGLLHAEAEFAIERFAVLAMENSYMKTKEFRPDPILANYCMYFSARVREHLGEAPFLKKRTELMSDGTAMVRLWDDHGGRAFFDQMIKKNHGAGMSYLERLLHPMGISISEKNFNKLVGVGVVKVTDFNPSPTMLNEFVVLRGSAMHASAASFHQSVMSTPPPALATRGSGVVQFVSELALILGRAW